MGKVTDGLSVYISIVCTCMYVYIRVYTYKMSSQYTYLMILFGNVQSCFLLLFGERQRWGLEYETQTCDLTLDYPQ